MGYGYSMPGHPTYGYNYAPPDAANLVAFAGKGGVYFGPAFDAVAYAPVLAALQPGASSITQPYVIDISDAALGYKNYANDSQGRPRFDGNYVQWDQVHTRPDATQRRFYEPTMTQAQFNALMAGGASFRRFDGVYFSNHVVGGWFPDNDVEFNGAIVCRDDAIFFRKNLVINHDKRLLDPSAKLISLPGSLKRPRLIKWRDITN